MARGEVDGSGGGDQRALVERARTGDADAWEALFRRSYPRLLAYAGRRLGSVDDAKDCVGETFARAVAGIAGFGWSGGGFDAWLYGIMRHVVIDTQRASGRRAPMPLDERACERPGPLDEVLGAEEAVAVRRAFARLGPADQELIELRVVGGLSAEATATVVGKAPGAVRMAQSRALGRLRGHLEAIRVGR